MFQSSRTASGKPRLQASSAFSPSSASRIWNSMPSRIRRATLRMTLESSTTRQVFITALEALCAENSATHSVFFATLFASRRDCLVSQTQNSIDIEQHQQLVVETVDAGAQFGAPRVEIDRVGLAQVVVELEHFADAINQQPVGFTAR